MPFVGVPPFPLGCAIPSGTRLPPSFAMSNDRVVQPLVACLGNPVAGNPTQFVMSRIAREAELDWRFFTSEVEPEEFEIAFRGVQALGLAGTAFLPPFERSGYALVHTASDAAECLGRVSIVRREEGQWVGDHTLASALIRWIDARWGPPILEKDDLMSASIAVFGSQALANAIASVAKQTRSDLSVFACRDFPSEQGRGGGADGSENTVGKTTAGSTELRSFDDLKNLERPIKAIVVEDADALSGAAGKALLKSMQSIAWAGSPFLLFAHGRWDCRASEAPWMESRGLEIAEEVELLAIRAAIDFQFWTGYAPKVDSIREALEEYLQW